MKITKIFTGGDNKSYFVDIEIDLKTQEKLGLYRSPLNMRKNGAIH